MDKIKEHSIDLTTRKMDERSFGSEPETFDTWTIISDPLNNLNKSEIDKFHNGNRIEILKENIVNDIPDIKYDPECIDELSDGISIISDSESAGRSSPMPLYTLETTTTNNINNGDDKDKIKFEYKIKECQYEPIITTNLESISQTAGTTSSYSNVDIINDNRIKENKSCQEISHHDTDNLPITKLTPTTFFTTKNLSLIFYLSATIAIIAFIAKMKYPEWGNVTLQEEIITQRVDDLELQNNLLRAEIDILSKQVNYLNTKETQNRNFFKSETVKKRNNDDNKNYNKKEKIKVWPGNGRIERTEIPKEALKMPHSCDQQQSDQNYDGICIEPEFTNTRYNNLPPKQFASNIANDGIGDSVKNIIVESIEKIVPIAENIVNSFKKSEEKINITENQNDHTKSSHRNSELNEDDKYGKHKKHEKYNKPNQQHNGKNIYQNNKIPDNNFNEKHNKNENYNREEFRNGEQQPQKQHKDEERLRHKNDNIQDSKIRNKYDDDNSSEKYNKKKQYKKNKDFPDENYENNSKEKYNNKKNKKYKENIYNDNYNKKEIDNWHENMMKNREEYRKQHHDKLKSNNWYMDRASGREEARIFEKDQFKKMRRQ